MLKFTPLEFETQSKDLFEQKIRVKFTPLEFETRHQKLLGGHRLVVKIYSVGVWNEDNQWHKKKPKQVKIYSVGVWNEQYLDPINQECLG